MELRASNTSEYEEYVRDLTNARNSILTASTKMVEVRKAELGALERLDAEKLALEKRLKSKETDINAKLKSAGVRRIAAPTGAASAEENREEIESQLRQAQIAFDKAAQEVDHLLLLDKAAADRARVRRHLILGLMAACAIIALAAGALLLIIAYWASILWFLKWVAIIVGVLIVLFIIWIIFFG